MLCYDKGMFIQMSKSNNWDGFDQAMVRLHADFSNIKAKVMENSAKLTSEAIKKNLESGGTFAGAPFQSNSPSTLEKKSGGSPLLDSLALLGQIGYVANGEQSMAGVLGSHPSGVDIGSIMENGAMVGKNSSVEIPARPFIGPVAESQNIQEEIQSMDEKLMREEVKGIFGGL